MPWSEWVQSPDYYAGATTTTYDWTPDGIIPGGDAGGYGGAGAAADSSGDVTNTFIVGETPTGWDALRDWSPPELDALTFGVDYVTRPDRAPGDLDQFIEYESTGANTLIGWDITGHPALLYHVPTKVSTGGAEPWDLRFVDPFPAIVDVFGGLPLGTVFASGSSSDANGTTYPFPAATPSTDRFGYVLDFVNSPPFPPGTRAAVIMPAPALKYRMPRWRYWMPAGLYVPHLRQVHRDDGLGVTPRRARGASSRALTNRAIAYD